LFYLKFIVYRKRSITQCIETHRSFETLYEQEERILDNLQHRMEKLEPLSNDTNQLRQSTKIVTVYLIYPYSL